MQICARMRAVVWYRDWQQHVPNTTTANLAAAEAHPDVFFLFASVCCLRAFHYCKHVLWGNRAYTLHTGETHTLTHTHTHGNTLQTTSLATRHEAIAILQHTQNLQNTSTATHHAADARNARRGCVCVCAVCRHQRPPKQTRSLRTFRA